MIKVLDKNRTLIVKDEIIIPKDGSIKFKDWRGATVAKITDKGWIELKEGWVKK